MYIYRCGSLIMAKVGVVCKILIFFWMYFFSRHFACITATFIYVCLLIYFFFFLLQTPAKEEATKRHCCWATRRGAEGNTRRRCCCWRWWRSCFLRPWYVRVLFVFVCICEWVCLLKKTPGAAACCCCWRRWRACFLRPGMCICVCACVMCGVWCCCLCGSKLLHRRGFCAIVATCMYR